MSKRAGGKQHDSRPSRRRKPSRTWVASTGAVVAALVALLAVSASHSNSRTIDRASDVAIAPPSDGGAVGGTVAELRLPSIAGQQVSVPTAGRPGVLLFSEESCASCIPSAQALSSIKARLGTRIDALMVDVNPSDTAQYLAEWGKAVGHPSYPLAIDTTGNVVNDYQIQALGTTIVYDAQGRIVDRRIDPSLADIEGGLRKAGI